MDTHKTLPDELDRIIDAFEKKGNSFEYVVAKSTSTGSAKTAVPHECPTELVQKNHEDVSEKDRKILFLESCLEETLQIQAEHERTISTLQNTICELSEETLGARRERERIAFLEKELLKKETEIARIQAETQEMKHQTGIEHQTILGAWYELGLQTHKTRFVEKAKEKYPELLSKINPEKESP
ncbi:MAG: uncharacterized protein A8A55_0010 [Amphiamblys sp. WSBS2006]|nr:MAG: uncharacterized protein A8A55_0010 [Amphiamblys sp. WSBS2006]